MKLQKNDSEIFNLDAKTKEDQEIKETFPDIEKELLQKLQSDTLKVYDYFNIKTMARVDFIVRD
jgi:D-alanine-D-alanine ligase-like ATP-grasp enzyme